MAAAGDQTFGTDYMAPGMYLDFSSSRTVAEPDRASTAQVRTVTPSTLTITVGGSISDVANDDFVILSRALNNCPNGIGGFWPLFNTAGTYLGLSTTTYPQLLPTRVTGVAAGNIEDALVGGLMQVLAESGEMPDMALTNWRTYKEIFIDAKSDRRFTNVQVLEKQKYALGYSATTITSPGGNPIDFFIDRFMPGNAAAASFGMIAVIKPKNIKWVRPTGKGPDWYKDESGSVLHQIPDTYGKKMVLLDHYNLICTKPRVNLFLEGITIP
jgi:hypothetical protein